MMVNELLESSGEQIKISEARNTNLVYCTRLTQHDCSSESSTKKDDKIRPRSTARSSYKLMNDNRTQSKQSINKMKSKNSKL